MARKDSGTRRATKHRRAAIARILTIDIGGSGLKAAVVDPRGKLLTQRHRIKTPRKCPPAKLVKLLGRLVVPLAPYDRISIGFPGYVRDGKVYSAPNLGTKLWAVFPLAEAIEKELGRPARLNNDADVQGLGVISGRGLELVCTLGTGLGSAWFADGKLQPHMDLAHFALHKKDDLDNYVGNKARKKIGHKHWNRRVKRLTEMLAVVMNYDRLYFGGGNSRHVDFPLPANVSLVSNEAGIEGGAFVWCPRRKKR